MTSALAVMARSDASGMSWKPCISATCFANRAGTSAGLGALATKAARSGGGMSARVACGNPCQNWGGMPPRA